MEGYPGNLTKSSRKKRDFSPFKYRLPPDFQYTIRMDPEAVLGKQLGVL